MSFFDRFKEKVKTIGDGSGRIHIGDPRFDDWVVVHEFEDLDTALAWQHDPGRARPRRGPDQ